MCILKNLSDGLVVDWIDDSDDTDATPAKSINTLSIYLFCLQPYNETLNVYP